MSHQILISTIIVLAVIFICLSLWSRKGRRWTVYEYFLASRSLRPSLVTSLLISGSFSLNGMLYQTYLGYKIGIWGLLPQIAWALSFVFLARYSDRLVGSKGLHNFLGENFSLATRKLAAICSVVGLSLQIGWEYSVSKSAFVSLTTPHLSQIAVTVVVGSIFAIATFYTLVGGLRSNSVTDLFQNLIKGACFLLIGILAYFAVGTGGVVFTNVVPDPGNAILEFTISGLIANLAFSLVWQFVDMSTWQTAIASGREGGADQARKSLRSASFWVFVAPGILGTFVGIALAGKEGLDPNTVLPALLSSAGGAIATMVVLTVALVATIMSFVDGMLLGIGFTVVTDLLFAKTVAEHNLLSAPTDEMRANNQYRRAVAKVMSGARITLIASALAGTIFLDLVSSYLGLDLFQQVYIVTIGQVSLIGPIFCALIGRSAKPGAGVFSILAGLAAGFALIAAGFAYGSPDLTNLAPVGALLLSLACAVGGTRPTVRTPA